MIYWQGKTHNNKVYYLEKLKKKTSLYKYSSYSFNLPNSFYWQQYYGKFLQHILKPVKHIT